MPETQNVYQKRWREKNREAYNKAQLKFVNKYYENNVYDNSLNRLFRIDYVIVLIKAILELKLNKKIIFIVRETKNKTSNAKILADWLAYNLQINPNKFKLLDKLVK